MLSDFWYLYLIYWHIFKYVNNLLVSDSKTFMFFQLYTVYLIIQDYINQSNEHAFDALMVQDNEGFAEQEDLFSPDLDIS